MTSRLTESAMYRHAWTTPSLDEILAEDARLRTWLRILAVLADCQARLEIIPEDAATAIAENTQADRLDLEAIAARTRESSHSVLGLIEGLQAMLPDEEREYVYYGITVQDLTDTWFGLVMRDVTTILRADLVRIQAACLRLAHEHRSTVMAGRTHGQIGSPITFGLKAATWADETARNIERLDEGMRRWAVVQLAGSTGGLAFFGDRGAELRALFSRALSLGDPGVSWTSTRDRTAEFGATLSLVTGALARIGNEVYELQRPEIAELSEPFNSAVVGSITMPHKRNPEYCEHLDTLARVARAAAGGLLEGTSASHERDGRAWKAEWAFLPDVALAAGTSASLGAELLEGLVVHPEAMRRNLGDDGSWASEQVLVQLSQRLGKHRAQALLQAAFASDESDVATTIAVAAGVDVADVHSWMGAPITTAATAMVDGVVARLGGPSR